MVVPEMMRQLIMPVQTVSFYTIFCLQTFSCLSKIHFVEIVNGYTACWFLKNFNFHQFTCGEIDPYKNEGGIVHRLIALILYFSI